MARQIALAGGLLTVDQRGTSPWGLDDLCDFASRQNPRRAFLFVSKVLGKHLPAHPAEMLKAHQWLASRLMPQLLPRSDTLFLGFAETATGLGAGVFEACLAHTEFWESAAPLYVQSTRYRFNAPVALHFAEEHSHATGHLVYEPQVRPDILHTARNLVLIDDELSTGQTNFNFLKAFLAVNPHVERVVMVSLLNWVGEERALALRAQLPDIDVRFVAAWSGAFQFESHPGFTCPPAPSAEGHGALMDRQIPLSFGRFGTQQVLRLNPDSVLSKLTHLTKSKPIRVVGDGEFMHVPFKVAQLLTAQGYTAYVQSTTRSPILVGGAIQEKTCFMDHYGEGLQNYAYNLPTDGRVECVLCHESNGPLNLTEKLACTSLAYGDVL